MKRYSSLLYTILIFQFACQTIQKVTSKLPQKTETVNKPASEQAKNTSSVQTFVHKPEPIALTINNSEVKLSDLQAYVEMSLSYDSLTPKAAIDEFVKYKRIELEAIKRGYDKVEGFDEELKTYRELNAQAYLTDSVSIKSLINEAIDWTQHEVHPAHIMYNLSEFADPKDTLVIYNKLIDIRNQALAGEDFAKLAEKYSQDKKTTSKGGDIGWFTAAQLIYPIEKVAFSLSKGGISMPFRTKGGYHILKLLDKRPNSGKVIVQHILKVIPTYSKENDVLKIKTQMDSIRTALINGADFDELNKKYSDDYKHKNFGGILPVLNIGKSEEAFEKAAFSLKEGEISEPVRTSSGWHIVKLVQKLPVDRKDELILKLRDKVVTDSRGDVVKEATFNRLKKQLNYVENTPLIQKAIAKADSNVYSKRWTYALNDELADEILFTYDGKNIKGKDFFEYVLKNYKTEKIPIGFTPTMLFRSYFKKYQENLIKTYAENNLEKVDKEFGALMSYYQTDLLKMPLLNDLIYEKSIEDTTSQRAFYELNKVKYIMPERALATIISSNSQDVISKVKEIISKGTPYKLNREPKGGPLFFNKYLTELTTDHKKRLMSLLGIMKRNPDYVIEVGGHNDAGEGDNAATERIRNVVAFFTQNGLPMSRIVETDYGKSKPMDRFDWSKNQRVSFQFFSNSKVDVEKVFNEKEPNTVKIQEGFFKKGENKVLNPFRWELGTQNLTIDKLTTEITIEKIEPQRYKTLKECKGEVIRDWQKQLENQFYTELEKKYPVKYNDEVIIQLLQNVK